MDISPWECLSPVWVSALLVHLSVQLVPRLTKLVAEDNNVELLKLYRNSTHLVAIVALPATLVLAFLAERVLWAWTGDSTLASKAAPTLRFYAAGNYALAFVAFPYYLQYAKGDLRLHLTGNFHTSAVAT